MMFSAVSVPPMRFDDLPRDRQAEAGILPEALAGGPVGVEALENAVDVRRRGCPGRCRRSYDDGSR